MEKLIYCETPTIHLQKIKNSIKNVYCSVTCKYDTGVNFLHFQITITKIYYVPLSQLGSLLNIFDFNIQRLYTDHT